MATLLEEILEATVRFKDDQGNDISIKGHDLKIYCPKNATYEQINEFKLKVEALGLDPRRGDAYMTLFKDKDGRVTVTILTNYQVYLRRAWASGKLDTFKVVINKPNENNPDTWTAKFIGNRTDSTKDFETPEIPMIEINKKRNLWNIMPTVMATVRMTTFGLRWMLTDVLGGMPYIAEEFDTEAESTTQTQKTTTNQTEKPKETNGDLDTLFAKAKSQIDENLTVATLDEWQKKNAKNITKSPNKDRIETYITQKRFDMTIETLAKLTTYDPQIIAGYLGTNPEQTAINDCVRGDSDAIKEVTEYLANYKASVDTQTDSEVVEEETELDAMTDERAI
jgi:hypothetical protein